MKTNQLPTAFPFRKASYEGGALRVDESAIRQIVSQNALPADGFRITATANEILLEGSNPAALAYGLASIRQICASNPEGTFPTGIFEDYPDFPVRGYMLDISRCKVPTMAHLCRLVDSLAALRYNQLQLYMEHTFAYPQHPVVSAEASPLTADEVRELDAYCKTRHIELVPNQNSFGHMERWLRHPQYRYLAECPDGFIHPIAGPRAVGSVLYPGPESLQFLEGLYDSLLPQFSSQSFHVGCDEPWELGQGRSREAVAELGKQRVYLDFLHQIEQRVRSRGRIMHYWADILLERPDLIAEAPADAVPVIWGYTVDHPFAKQCALLAEHGMTFQVAPGDATWKCFSGRLETTLHNQQQAAREGLRHGAKGYLLTHWGDLGHHQTWPMSLPGMVIGGQLAWHAEAEVEDSLVPLLNALFFKQAEPHLAEALLALGRLDARVPKILVGSWFYDALMRQVDETIAPVLAGELLDQLDAIERTISRSGAASADDADWLCEEMRLGLEMTRWAIIRNGGQGDVSAYEKARLELIERFKAVWLRRNRSGGLAESISYF